MGEMVLYGFAAMGAVAVFMFLIKHSVQFAKWVSAARAKIKAGIPPEVQTRIDELERIVKQHDSVLAAVAAKPIPQPASPAATPPA